MGQALLYPLRIGEKHLQNGEVSAPLTSGACGYMSECFYPARGITKIKVIGHHTNQKPLNMRFTKRDNVNIDPLIKYMCGVFIYGCKLCSKGNGYMLEWHRRK